MRVEYVADVPSGIICVEDKGRISRLAAWRVALTKRSEMGRPQSCEAHRGIWAPFVVVENLKNRIDDARSRHTRLTNVRTQNESA